MKFNTIYWLIFLFLAIGCHEETCVDNFTYTLNILDSEGSVLRITSANFDSTSVYQVSSNTSFNWDFRADGSPGISLLKLGLPSTREIQFRINNMYPEALPPRVIYNTGDPFLTGYQWQYFSSTAEPTFDDITLEGEFNTGLTRERFNVYVEIQGPTPAEGERCIIKHLIELDVVR